MGKGEPTYDGPLMGVSTLCEPVLRALPEWFGIEEALRRYVGEIDGLPAFVARVDGRAVGFLTLRQHYDASAELHLIAVMKRWQRQGVGRRLLDTAERYLRERGVRVLYVKTLGPSHPDVHYARTRAFYEGVGFLPLEEFPTVWNPQNPCLIMVKSL